MIEFFVAGIPAPKGSTRSFWNKNVNRVVTIADNRDTQKAWQSNVSYVASQYFQSVMEGPIHLDVTFYLKRPPSIPKSRVFPIVKPDLDKLERATWDGLTGVAFVDDAQVVQGESRKLYAVDGKTGCLIRIRQVIASDSLNPLP